jgi:hypothetical protein
MKILLTTIALAATAISSSALAAVGCKPGEPMNSSVKASACRDESPGYAIVSPMAWAPGAYASAAPQRHVVIRRGASDRDEDTRLQGGAAE